MVKVVVRDQTAVKVAGDATRVAKITVGTPINVADVAQGSLVGLDDVNNSVNKAHGTILQFDSASNKFIHVSFDSAQGNVKSNFSVTDAGGDGSLSYDSTNGVFTYTGPSAAEVRAHIVAGSNITYDSATGVISSTASGGGGGGPSNTDELSEGASNFYFTDSLARNAISVNDTGGLGSLSYNSPTGVVTYAGPSVSDIRNQLVAGDGITYDSASGLISSNITQNNFDSAEARKSISVTDAGGAGSLTYNNSNGVITYTGISDSAIRSLFSTSGSISYDSASGNISFTERTDSQIRQLFASSGGALSYDTGTGVFGVDLTNATTIDDSALVKSIFTAANTGTGHGSISYNSSTGQFTYTKVTDSNIVDALTGDSHINITSSGINNGLISYTGTINDSNDAFSATNIINHNSISIFLTGDSARPPGDLDTQRFGFFQREDSSNTFRFFGVSRKEIVKQLEVENITENGPMGSLDYDNDIGKFTYYAPTFDEVRSSFSIVSIDNADSIGERLGGLTYDSEDGRFTFIHPGVDSIRALFTASGNISYDQNTGRFTYSDSDHEHPDPFDSGHARQSISVTVNDPSIGSVGSGNLQYNNVSGVLTFTKVTDSDIRSTLTVQNNGSIGSISYDSSQGIISYTSPSTIDIRSKFSAQLTDSPGVVVGSFTYDSSSGVFAQGVTIDSIRSLFSVDNLFSHPGALSYNQSTGQFIHHGDEDILNARAAISVDSYSPYGGLGRLIYFRGDSIDSGGIFRYLGPTGDSIKKLFDSSGAFAYYNPTGTVNVGTYGAASLIPVLTVNSKGFIDSIGTTQVAGVDSVSFDSASFVYTINTADGNVYNQMVHTRSSAAGTYGSSSTIPIITVNQYGHVDSVGTLAVAGVTGLDFDSTNGNLTITTSAGTSFTDTITLDPYSTSNLVEGSNLYYTDTRVDTRLASGSVGNVQITGYLRGPTEFIIDPATHGTDSGTLKILGNLQVEGTTTTINSTTLSVNDKNIVIADSAADSSALDGGGITWGGDSILNNPSLTYTHLDSIFSFNRPIDVTGNSTFNVPASGGRLTLLSPGTHSGTGPTLYLDRIPSDNSVSNWDMLGDLRYRGLNSAGATKTYHSLSSRIRNATAGSEDAVLYLKGYKQGTWTELYNFDTYSLQMGGDQYIEWYEHDGTSYDVKLYAPTPSADRTIYLPDSDGTILVTGNGNERFDALLDSHLSPGYYRPGNITRQGYLQLLDNGTVGTNFGPSIYLDKRPSDNSTSDGDYLGAVNFRGENSAQEVITYSGFYGRIVDQTDGVEDGRIEQYGMKNGTFSWLSTFDPYRWALGADQYIEWTTHNGSSYDVRLQAATPSADRRIIIPDLSGDILLKESDGSSNTKVQLDNSKLYFDTAEKFSLAARDSGVIAKFNNYNNMSGSSNQDIALWESKMYGNPQSGSGVNKFYIYDNYNRGSNQRGAELILHKHIPTSANETQLQFLPTIKWTATDSNGDSDAYGSISMTAHRRGSTNALRKSEMTFYIGNGAGFTLDSAGANLWSGDGLLYRNAAGKSGNFGKNYKLYAPFFGPNRPTGSYYTYNDLYLPFADSAVLLADKEAYLAGHALMLDSDRDTTIQASTDDRIDIKTGGTTRSYIDSLGIHSDNIFIQDSIHVGRGIMFEGDSNNNFETQLNVVNPTSDRIINLPDNSGTLALTSQLGSFDSLSSNLSINVDNVNGSILTLNRITTTLAGTSTIGELKFSGHNNAGILKEYGDIVHTATSTTNGSETSNFTIRSMETGGLNTSAVFKGSSQELYYNNNKKFETTTDGTTTTGTAKATTKVNTPFVEIEDAGGSNQADIQAYEVALTTTAAGQNLHIHSTSAYRSHLYKVTAKTGTKYQMSQIHCIHNGTDAWITEFGVLKTQDSAIATYDAEVSGSFKFTVTPAYTNTTFNVVRISTHV